MKSVLMPPGLVDGDNASNMKKSKLSEAFSEQLSKHEWEQVGNQGVHQNRNKDSSIDAAVP